MARTLYEVTTALSGEELEQRLKAFLLIHDFLLREYRDEKNVYRTGNGFLTAVKYLKYTLVDNRIILEGWISAYGIWESPLSGFFGAIPKQSLKDTIERLKFALSA